MHVISKKKLRVCTVAHADAAASLNAWYNVTKEANWPHLPGLRQTYSSADQVGKYTVFNIRGNKYRLITQIEYSNQTVRIVAFLTHEEYDLGRWKE